MQRESREGLGGIEGGCCSRRHRNAMNRDGGDGDCLVNGLVLVGVLIVVTMDSVIRIRTGV